MEINERASAGTLEKNDCLITVLKGNGDIQIHIESKVVYEYGQRIEDVIRDTLKKLKINNITVNVQDMGAFDYTIRARLEAAIYRSLKQVDQIPWGDLLYES